MSHEIRMIGAGLTLLAGLPRVSGVAWAQASKTPVLGEVLRNRITDPGEVWLDEEGVEQIGTRGRAISEINVLGLRFSESEGDHSHGS